ncbi:Chromosome transmission fidelity protein 8-like protein [Ooceraea biroi]|nr:Chromosome transmission fidelity protein 8-like protein [Ooceraea biroi]
MIEDWAIIDLQGDLKFEKVENSEDQLVGDLHFTKTGVPILIIGIHVLHGKEVTLEKPLFVLKKYHENVENDTLSEQHGTETKYTVMAIVRKKLLFRSRPKPIVTNVPKPC